MRTPVLAGVAVVVAILIGFLAGGAVAGDGGGAERLPGRAQPGGRASKPIPAVPAGPGAPALKVAIGGDALPSSSSPPSAGDSGAGPGSNLPPPSTSP
jgi:hypothetical protein